MDPKKRYFRVLTVPGLSRQLPVCKSPNKVSDFFLHHPAIELARVGRNVWEIMAQSFGKKKNGEFCLFEFINLCLLKCVLVNICCYCSEVKLNLLSDKRRQLALRFNTTASSFILSWSPSEYWHILVINPCSPTRIQKIQLTYLHVTCNYVSLNITMHHYPSPPITVHHHLSLSITTHHYISLFIIYILRNTHQKAMS